MAMKPFYEEAAVAMVNQPVANQAQLVKIDCTVQSDKPLCMRFGITGFPTIKLFRRANPADLSSPLLNHFNLQRTAMSFLMFCSQMFLQVPGVEMPKRTVAEDQQQAQMRLLVRE
jgi:hypothetical protein